MSVPYHAESSAFPCLEIFSRREGGFVQAEGGRCGMRKWVIAAAMVQGCLVDGISVTSATSQVVGTVFVGAN